MLGPTKPQHAAFGHVDEVLLALEEPQILDPHVDVREIVERHAPFDHLRQRAAVGQVEGLEQPARV